MNLSNKNFILFDDSSWAQLLPITFTRPVAEMRIGILTLKEKWDIRLKSSCSYLTQPYLSKKYPLLEGDESILINSSVLPGDELINEILTLKLGNYLKDDSNIIAVNFGSQSIEDFSFDKLESFTPVNFKGGYFKINHIWEIFTHNGEEIETDYRILTQNRQSQSISKTNQVINPENIFIEEGAVVECAIINASAGPVYIGKDAEVMEGSVIRGPFALCEHSGLKLGAKIYGPTTIGPHSKVGGEVNNSVIIGYSNKAHDGFLGNSVIGEWCNLGADSNNSNLKNNYASVKIWNYTQEKFTDTGLQFCGLIMGDHSKCGINTMFNTGTVVGVNANIYGAGFPRNFIPSFSWGGQSGFITYLLPKAFEVAEKVMKRRNIPFTEKDKMILEHIFNETQKFRKK